MRRAGIRTNSVTQFQTPSFATSWIAGSVAFLRFEVRRRIILKETFQYQIGRHVVISRRARVGIDVDLQIGCTRPLEIRSDPGDPACMPSLSLRLQCASQLGVTLRQIVIR